MNSLKSSMTTRYCVAVFGASPEGPISLLVTDELVHDSFQPSAFVDCINILFRYPDSIRREDTDR